MTERTALGEQILRHWRKYSPRMVRDLERMNKLDQTVFETQERVGELMHDLMVCALCIVQCFFPSSDTNF